MVYSHYFLHLLPCDHLQVFEFYLLWLLYCIYPLYHNLLHRLLPKYKHQYYIYLFFVFLLCNQYHMCKIHKILPIHDFLVNDLLQQHQNPICQPKIKIKKSYKINTKNIKHTNKKPVKR